jgi:hypothetical protein
MKLATPILRAILKSWSDEDLELKYEFIFDLTMEGIRQREKEHGMSFPEILLKRCAENHELFGNLPSTRGGAIKDHCLPGYNGFKSVRRGWLAEELVWSSIPPLAPLDKKIEIAIAQREKALEMYLGSYAPPVVEDHLRFVANHPWGDETFGSNAKNHSRLLIAETQAWLLTAFVGPRKRRQLTREEMIDAVIFGLKFGNPEAFAQALAIAKDAGLEPDEYAREIDAMAAEET